MLTAEQCEAAPPVAADPLPSRDCEGCQCTNCGLAQGPVLPALWRCRLEIDGFASEPIAHELWFSISTSPSLAQGEYCLRYGAVGSRVALVASEPITRRPGDWVAVPRNTALIVLREKVGSAAQGCRGIAPDLAAPCCPARIA